jgi:hypothetical protein
MEYNGENTPTSYPNNLLFLKKHAKIDLKPENSPLMLNLSRDEEVSTTNNNNSALSSFGFLTKKLGTTGFNQLRSYYQGFN